MTEIERKLLAACAQGSMSSPGLLQAAGYRSRTGNFKKALSWLLSQGLLEMTLPDRPRSKSQRYRLTEKGSRVLEAGGAKRR